MDLLKYFYKNVPHTAAKKIYLHKRTRYFLVKNSFPEFITASLEYDIWSTRSFNERNLAKVYDNFNVVLMIATNDTFLGYALVKSRPGSSSKSKSKLPNVKFDGSVFDIAWVRVLELNSSYHMDILNKLQHNKPVVSCKDGDEIQKDAGFQLCRIFEKRFNRCVKEFSSMPSPTALPTGLMPPIPKLVPDLPSNFILPKSIESMMKIKSMHNMSKMQRKLKGASVYSLDMAAEFNPALIIFPIDLSNMSYDTYISLYNFSHEYWLKMPQDFDFLSLTSSKT